ncbi:multidrug efflux MFS transporter EmrD [Candidatus Schneideria nysicola]|uniref:multidrug efflux MFS transporter EmrD n=1 Tax=Candidatus Schneideria nysicola TaxID=1081631 RepID=UPI001CAA5670|nr:multidrug efflux MFS transporter EmrD [Candidatus Schneideria nysicola]UAJ65375.1 multidrug efflux MFS transporter EmrD [Candidatus Schneideria nysicola]UAJ65906.1 multidrug efflux MFS transporter EmrD [Candidatus Schneideria nysicola]
MEDTKKNIFRIRILILLILLVAVGQMTQAIYIAGIPIMASELKVPEGTLQRLLAAYLLCYGISQLIYGPLSDHFGRRPMIFLGMGIFYLGTLMAMNSYSLLFVTFSCGIQGMGTGVSGVMARVLLRDTCKGNELRRTNSLLNMGVIFIPLVAPLIGGILSNYLGWRSCFVFLLILSSIISIIIWWFLPETRPLLLVKSYPKIFIFKYLLCEKTFNHYLLILVGGVSGIVAFKSSSGVLLGNMGFSVYERSILFILPLPSTFLGAWYVSRITISFKHSMWLAVLSCIGAGLLMWIPAWFNIMTLWTLILPASLFFFGAGMLFPLATTGAMEPYPYFAGTAGALVGSIQNIVSGVIAGFSSLLPQNNQHSLGMITFSMGLMILLCWISLARSVNHNN